MPFESYQPGKESREIDRAQREHVAGEEVRLGFARSHTETAKPMDTLKGMIKRAYKEGKLYSEKQASEAAGVVVEKLQVEASRKGIDKIRINPGDRITFRNDSIALSQFDRTKGGFVDTRIGLMEEEGSIRREIVGSAQLARADLSEELANPSEGATRQPKAPEKERSIADQRREAFQAFIRDREELRRIIRSEEERVEGNKLQIYSYTKPFSAIPPQFKDYEFSEIIAKGVGGQKNYMIGLKPQTGEVAMFNAKTPEKVIRQKIKDFSDLRGLKLALAMLANPDRE